MKIALLSNVNMNGTVRILKRDNDIYDSEGYGNEIGTLMNPSSSIYSYKPDIIFLLEDLMELIGHELDKASASKAIENWFSDFKSSVKNDTIYYVSDAYLFGKELEASNDFGLKMRIENIWQTELEKMTETCKNVRIFPYRKLCQKLGEDNAFSMKMWYMGKILHTPALLNVIAEEIKSTVEREQRVPKKVLVLDLDNTLWGGLAGENDITPIVLSDDHAGLAYKNLQRVIKMMKSRGVLLAVVSKNNEEDAMEIIEKHPHMVLRPDDFVNLKINWENKADNLLKTAKELNLGLDSFVFFDDSETERQIIKDMLPEVTVPEVSNQPENLADDMIDIWNKYFSGALVTKEDLDKTSQYLENAKREAFKSTTVSFDDYLEGLAIVAQRIEPNECIDRITQLLNKTNQFNLTTIRHTNNEIAQMLNDKNNRFFVYQISDRFGDYGIVAVAITSIVDDTLSIDEFVMSCRVMGKNIENAIVDDIENFALNSGCKKVIGHYIETAKNAPVKELYKKLGYVADGEREYVLSLDLKKQRDFKLTMR